MASNHTSPTNSSRRRHHSPVLLLQPTKYLVSHNLTSICLESPSLRLQLRSQSKPQFAVKVSVVTGIFLAIPERLSHSLLSLQICKSIKIRHLRSSCHVNGH